MLDDFLTDFCVIKFAFLGRLRPARPPRGAVFLAVSVAEGQRFLEGLCPFRTQLSAGFWRLSGCGKKKIPEGIRPPPDLPLVGYAPPDTT